MKLLAALWINLNALLLYSAIIAICSTLRYEKKGEENLNQAGGNVLFAVWHQATFVMFYLYRRKNAAILVSSEIRGQILGRCASWFGFKVVVLSSAGSLAKIIKHIKEKHAAVIAVDGPAGPIFEVKPGLAYLAAKARVNILPVGVAVRPRFTLIWRWDKYFIPLPFAKVKISIGEAIAPREITTLKTVLHNLSCAR